LENRQPGGWERRISADAPAIPDELASLAGNRSALPDHIRQVIATLAGA
jgi:hypothetical protein